MLRKIRVVTLMLCLSLGSQVHALEIILNDVNPAGSDPAALAAFEEAAAIWESIFSDDVTVRIDVTFETLPPGVLGGTSRNFVDTVDYSVYRDALIADALSADDAAAVASLAAGPTFDYMIEDLDGSGTTYSVTDQFGTSALNSFLDVNTATLKAVGLLDPHDISVEDASIAFSDSFNFDFDRSDGIAADAFDFVGVAAHEIGHALGFISGVDFLDFFTGPDGVGYIDFGPFDIDSLIGLPFGIATPLDLFRYSAEGQRDLTLGAFGTPYYSLDNGLTTLGTFSTGSFNGDGRQASHWQDDLGLGIMDPTAGFGEFLMISALDISSFDVIGWDIEVPEPGTIGLLVLGLLAVAATRRRRAVIT